MKIRPIFPARIRCAFTLIEMLIAITIMVILASAAIPAYNSIVNKANETVCVSGLQQMVSGTMNWAADHGGKIPSPKYSASDPGLPDYWKLDTDGEEGLWLNGVIFAQMYLEDPEKAAEGSEDGPATGSAVGISQLAETGKHLVGTVFENKLSVRKNAAERDWYRHSYAMNANLMYDEIATVNGAADPWLTEKAIAKFDPVSAMLFIDCIDQNIVMATDRGLIIEAADQRYDGKRVLAAFLDGHVDKLIPKDVPEADPETDRRSSLFWRGILPER
jgi:prepilin-type N-terminal cleavage/methylation domain-containing protein